MFSSNSKRLYDLILNKLNENTQEITVEQDNGTSTTIPVEFSGNYMFKFSQSQGQVTAFDVVKLNANVLDFTYTEYIPLVDAQSIEIPFVEQNERSDWEREFYTAIKIPSSVDSVTGNMIIEFSEDNPRYQAVLETLETLRSNLTFTEGGYKYTFKVKEPTKVSVLEYNGDYYQILALTFNLTSVKKGFFGNETKVYLYTTLPASLEDARLDVVEFTEVVGKTARANSNSNSDEETVAVDKRTWEATITVNFNGSVPDMLLYDEKSATADIDQEYTIAIQNTSLDDYVGTSKGYLYTVVLTTINATYKNNQIDQFTFKVERV